MKTQGNNGSLFGFLRWLKNINTLTEDFILQTVFIHRFCNVM